MKRKQFLVDVDGFTLNVIKIPVREIAYRKLAQNGLSWMVSIVVSTMKKRRFTKWIVKRLERWYIRDINA